MIEEIEFKTPILTYLAYIGGLGLALLAIYHYGFEYRDNSQLLIFTIASIGILFAGWVYENIRRLSKENKDQWALEDLNGKRVMEISDRIPKKK